MDTEKQCTLSSMADDVHQLTAVNLIANWRIDSIDSILPHIERTL